MRDAARLAKLFGDGEAAIEHRNIFVVNKVGEAGNRILSLNDIHSVIRVQPTSTIPFLPNLVSPAAHNGLIAASKRSKFASAVAELALELSGRNPRRSWWRRAAK